LKDTGLMILNHNVPCSCACRHCFFQSNKKAEHGVPYEQGERIALAFSEWQKSQQHSSDFPISYAISHCADYPELASNIELNRRLNGVSHQFLQINGIRLMEKPYLSAYLHAAKSAGVTHVDTTFYGLQEYHDNFAARKGDFHYLLDILAEVVALGMTPMPSFAVHEKNKEQLADLVALIKAHTSNTQRINGFLQDYRGNGENMENIRLTKTSFYTLPDSVQQCVNISRYQSESDWLKSGDFSEPTKRYLILSLRPENVKMFEGMSCDSIIRYLVDLDEAYHSAIPPTGELAAMYGDSGNDRLYQQRDLYWKWQKQYIKDNNPLLPDITDQRFCGSVRS